MPTVFGSRRCARTFGRPRTPSTSFASRPIDMKRPSATRGSPRCRTPGGCASSKCRAPRQKAIVSHLAESCVETLQMTLDEVASEMERRSQWPSRRQRTPRTKATKQKNEEAAAIAASASPEEHIAESPAENRSAWPRQHDGHRSVRRAGNAAHVPDHAAEGPDRFDPVDRRHDQEDRRDQQAALPRGVRGSTKTSR